MSNESRKLSSRQQRVALQPTNASFPPIAGTEQPSFKKSKKKVETSPEKMPLLARIRNETERLRNDIDRFLPDTGRLRPDTARLRPGTGLLRPGTAQFRPDAAQFRPDVSLIAPKSSRNRQLMKQASICLPAIPTTSHGKGAYRSDVGPRLPTPKLQEMPQLPSIRKSHEKPREKPFPNNCMQQNGYYSNDDELPKHFQPPNTPSGFELPLLVPPEPSCIELGNNSRFYQVNNDSGCSISCNDRESNATLHGQGSLHKRCDTLSMNHGVLPPRPPTPATTHGILPPTRSTSHGILPPTRSTSHGMLRPRPPTQATTHDMLPPRPPTQATTHGMLPPRPPTGKANAATMQRNSRRYGTGKKSFH